jgi:hypothetical protein
MICEEWKNTFKSLFPPDNHRPADASVVPEDFKAHMAVCRQCRTSFQTAFLLNRGFVLRKKAPQYLSRRITAILASKDIRHTPTRYAYALIPLASAVLIALSVFVTLTFFTPQNELVRVQLVLEAADATSVSVVGDWNGWDPQSDMLTDDNRDGIWEIELYLSPKKDYRYQFFIDGTQWIPDPRSPLTVEDGFGGVNSILDIDI